MFRSLLDSAVFEHAVRCVTEGQVLNFEASGAGRCLGVWCIRDLELGFAELVDSVHRGAAALEERDRPAKADHWPGEVADEEEERHEGAKRHGALCHANSTKNHHEGGGDAEHEVERGLKERADSGEPKVLAEMALGESGESASVIDFAGVALDDSDAGVRFAGALGHVREVFLHVFESVEFEVRELVRDEQDEGHRDERDEREFPRQDAQHEEHQRDQE